MAYDLTGKKCLITGATGLIGSNVALRLLKQGIPVRAFVRNRSKAAPLEKSGAEIFLGDITEPDSVQKAVAGCQVVFHFAGVIDDFRPRSFFTRVNVDGTRNAALAAINSGAERFIHTSSVMVYGMKAGLNTNEDSPYCISNEKYCDTKLEAEQLVRALIQEKSLPAIIVQPSQVYGPNDPTWTMKPIKLIQHGRMVLAGGGKGQIQFIYIDDLVDGILAAATRGRMGEAYILCGDKPININDYFGHMARMLGRPPPPKVPAWFALGVASLSEFAGKLFRVPPLVTRQEIQGTMLASTFDGSKARAELGFSPKISFTDGMKRLEEWLKSSEFENKSH